MLWIAALVLGAAGAPASAATPGYATSGAQCDGFPRLDLTTAAGVCIGMVAQNLGFVRGVAVLGEDVFVADMGGWQPGRGRILRLGHGGRDAPVALASGLDLPNALAAGPDGTLYVGLADRIVRIDPRKTDPMTGAVEILTHLPATGRHPLAAFAVAGDGSLFVNVGSATDHCENDDGSAPDARLPCPETLAHPARASVLHVMPGPVPIDASTLVPFARGLRNSMALAVLASGQPVAAVNARDAIDRADPALSDEELPHDTYVRILAGSDYGWPYCFDQLRPSPEYAHFDCASMRAPTLLLPAHAAPLGLIQYHGHALAGLDDQLVITYHGYRRNGHRIVLQPIAADGTPRGAARDLVSGWTRRAGVHPQGAPVGICETDDGRLLVTDDHNGTLLRIAPIASALR